MRATLVTKIKETSDRDVAGDHRLRSGLRPRRPLYSWKRLQTVAFLVITTDVAVDGRMEPVPFAGKSRLVRLSFSVAQLASQQATENSFVLNC